MKACNLFFASSLAFFVGCFESKPMSDAAPPTAASAESTPRETIGKTTQNVLDLDAALADGGVLAATSINETDPLLQSAAAYRISAAKLGAIPVTQAIQIRNAQSINDPKPLSHEDLMSDIIKVGQTDGITLPMLPYYQEYAWDVKNQKLVVVDFPARQAEREKTR